MYTNALGAVHKQRRWTKDAIHCYERNCVCNGCIHKFTIESTYCHMKAAVLESIRVLGIPKLRAIK